MKTHALSPSRAAWAATALASSSRGTRHSVEPEGFRLRDYNRDHTIFETQRRKQTASFLSEIPRGGDGSTQSFG
jgi:hypothetical protein